jgi:hypothetical protein
MIKNARQNAQQNEIAAWKQNEQLSSLLILALDE